MPAALVSSETTQHLAAVLTRSDARSSSVKGALACPRIRARNLAGVASRAPSRSAWARRWRRKTRPADPVRGLSGGGPSRDCSAR